MTIPDRKTIKKDLVSLLSQGSHTSKDAYEALTIKWQLTPSEINQKRGNDILFHHEIRWARQELTIEGIIDRPQISGRSIWQLKNESLDVTEHFQPNTIPIVPEGASVIISVNRYERSRSARAICLKRYGYACKACGLDFEKKYGAIGHECIHVHHRVPISSIGKKYCLDPIRDLIPLCPNCHYIAHRREPPFTEQEIAEMIKNAD